MFPLLPFALGLLTGAATVRVLKSANLRGSLDKAQDRLRDATVSGLNAIEHSSAELRAKLTTPPAVNEASSPAADAAERTSEEAKPARKPVRKRASTKAATEPAVAAPAPRRRRKAAGSTDAA